MKATILYPWADVVGRRSGAGLRVAQLVDFVAERCDEVVVLSVANAQDVQDGNVAYRFVRGADFAPAEAGERTRPGVEGRRTAMLARGGARLRSVVRRTESQSGGRRPRMTPGELQAVDFFARFCFGHALQEPISAAIEGADAVFLEYPFWARAVVPMCRARGIPSIVTVYDVLSRTFGETPAGEEFLLREELDALRSADHACCASREDQAFFAQHGVAATCLANPIDLEHCLPEPLDDHLDGFRDRHRLGDRPICLFFGSAHPPNNDAAETIRRLAPSVPQATFVIAGTCASPGVEGNCVRLGQVSDHERRVLYTIASLVIIPLRRGTGSSLKLIEALAFGSPVLCTRVGARGYGVEDGVHAVVCDDLVAYPELVTSLLGNDARRAQLRRGGRELAERFDRRLAFLPYAEMLGGRVVAASAA